MVKLLINGDCCVDADKRAENIAYAKGLGHPYVQSMKRPPLIILGGGHSIKDHLYEVRAHSGDRWIIGSAFRWWHEHYVDGTFFSAHPSPKALSNITGVKKALLASVTDPAVFDQLKGVDIELYDSEFGGSTTATAAPYLAAKMGYTDVTFYGCDSCYAETTHAYMDAEDLFLIRGTIGGKEYLTGAEFLMQAEFLSAIIKAAPTVFKEESGGLLRAMIQHDDWDTTHVSPKLFEGMRAA